MARICRRVCCSSSMHRFWMLGAEQKERYSDKQKEKCSGFVPPSFPSLVWSLAEGLPASASRLAPRCIGAACAGDHAMPYRERCCRTRRKVWVVVSHTSSEQSEPKAVEVTADRLSSAVRCRKSGALLEAVPRYDAESGECTGLLTMPSCRLAYCIFRQTVCVLTGVFLLNCPPEHDPPSTST